MYRIYFISLILLWEFCSCMPSKHIHDKKNPTKLQSLVNDFHSRFDRFDNKENKNVPLDINACFFEHNTSVYIALAGLEKSVNLEHLLLYKSPSDLYKKRKDMLGYCLYGEDRLVVYNSVKNNNSNTIHSYLKGLVLQDADKIYKDQFDYYLKEDMEEGGIGDFYHFFCVYQIDSCSNYCLVDSGFYYQLIFHDFYYDDWPDVSKRNEQSCKSNDSQEA